MLVTFSGMWNTGLKRASTWISAASIDDRLRDRKLLSSMQSGGFTKNDNVPQKVKSKLSAKWFEKLLKIAST